MKGYIGRAEQIVRGVTGAVLVLLAGLGIVTGPLNVFIVVAGSLGVVTATAGVCPLYRLLGRSTYRA
jgi:hypothetical protein